MTNKERIAENNNQLRECIALADAGGSGVGEYVNMECYYKWGSSVGNYYTLAQLFMGAGYSPAITYYVVDALPENPNVTNMATANPAHVYIYNDVPYVYGNAGYGDMWMGVVDVLAVLGDITTTAKGFTYYIEGETEEGVYVTYDQISQEGVDGLKNGLTDAFAVTIETLETENATLTNENTSLTNQIGTLTTENESLTSANATLTTEIETLKNDKATLEAEVMEKTPSANFTDYAVLEWRADSVFLTDITNVEIESIKIPDSVTNIDSYAFQNCYYLESITLPNSVIGIGQSAFWGCGGLTSINLPDSLTNIGISVFQYCSKLSTINFGGTKAQWKALSKSPSWNKDMPDYTIYCTDGTIAKDGTET